MVEVARHPAGNFVQLGKNRAEQAAVAHLAQTAPPTRDAGAETARSAVDAPPSDETPPADDGSAAVRARSMRAHHRRQERCVRPRLRMRAATRWRGAAARGIGKRHAFDDPHEVFANQSDRRRRRRQRRAAYAPERPRHASRVPEVIGHQRFHTASYVGPGVAQPLGGLFLKFVAQDVRVAAGIEMKARSDAHQKLFGVAQAILAPRCEPHGVGRRRGEASSGWPTRREALPGHLSRPARADTACRTRCAADRSTRRAPRERADAIRARGVWSPHRLDRGDRGRRRPAEGPSAPAGTPGFQLSRRSKSAASRTWWPTWNRRSHNGCSSGLTKRSCGRADSPAKDDQQIDVRVTETAIDARSRRSRRQQPSYRSAPARFRPARGRFASMRSEKRATAARPPSPRSVASISSPPRLVERRRQAEPQIGLIGVTAFNGTHGQP